MTITHEAPPDTARLASASLMQRLVPELVSLALHAKQAHWNVHGPLFVPLHELTDQLAADAGKWTDRVAERAVALGFSVDARPATVASGAPPFPGGHLADREVISELEQLLARVAATARSSLEELERVDPVAHDITVEVLEGLDKYRWMLRAQRS